MWKVRLSSISGMLSAVPPECADGGKSPLPHGQEGAVRQAFLPERGFFFRCSYSSRYSL